MKYRESNIDRSLRKWFIKEFDCANLRSIDIPSGSIRGLSSLSIKFDYPITAIAGKNGAGKSTLLALVCCAFHNTDKDFALPNRKQNYYTFADFFIQHKDEIPPTGIKILYGIAHNNWRVSEKNPDKVKIGYQARTKSKGGKWNDYSLRVERDVVFIGIERIVPHSEKSQSKSYRRHFKSLPPKGWEAKTKDSVGYILGKEYENFEMTYHSKYKLPIAQSNGIIYSGFNMGAGENALFEIFSTINSCPEGTLFVIDEIELGLHAEAQKRFITKLKEVCLDKKAQVIFTTHSKEIFDCLPEEARIYIERIGNKCITTKGISSEYAFSKLSAEKIPEAEILVEDKIAKSIINAILPISARSRLNIEIVGSATALCVQLAALSRRNHAPTTLVIFDGDQRKKEKDLRAHTKKISETQNKDFDNWFDQKIGYLPGAIWPERWLLSESKTEIETLSNEFGLNEQETLQLIDLSIQAGKHKEFYQLSNSIGLSEEIVIHTICKIVAKSKPKLFEEIFLRITNLLN